MLRRVLPSYCAEPCGLHGICLMTADYEFVCRCLAGYSGSACQDAMSISTESLASADYSVALFVLAALLLLLILVGVILWKSLRASTTEKTESEIKKKSIKAALPKKGIKHWFRNTLFKPTKSETPTTVQAEEKQAAKSALIVSPAEASSELAAAAAAGGGNGTSAGGVGSAGGPMSQMAPSCNTSSSGRRANRTRITDFQRTTLQQFFDKQAYPKDDDMEELSKKLQLNRRVIVVWFQYARAQKMRTIKRGSNFQCKRCNQVFEAYLALLRHQQNTCYKDDVAALASDNKIFEKSPIDEEKSQLLAQQQAAHLATLNLPKIQPSRITPLQIQIMKNVFVDYKTPSKEECELLGKEIGLHKRVVEVVFQNARAKEMKDKRRGMIDTKGSMNTKCDLCDKQHPTRLAMQDHLISTEHIQLLKETLKREGVPDVYTPGFTW